MLQNLLAERFKLALHHETKELPMYALVVGKGGPKLKEAAEEDAATPQGAAPPPPPPPPPGRDEAGPVRLKMGVDGMPQLPSGMGKNGMIMMMIMDPNGGGMRVRMVGKGQPISALLEPLRNQLGRPVVDATGLTAKYDITLDYAPDGLSGPMGMMPPPPPPHDGAPGGGGPMPSATDAGGPTIFTALQEQLGLKLEQRKGPVDLLVIDHLEKLPTEN
jgi:uncharacterized protein (TIGR03435 family)